MISTSHLLLITIIAISLYTNSEYTMVQKKIYKTFVNEKVTWLYSSVPRIGLHYCMSNRLRQNLIFSVRILVCKTKTLKKQTK